MYDDVEEVDVSLEDCHVICKTCQKQVTTMLIVATYGGFCSYPCIAEYKQCEAEYLYEL